jgi:hypothetical protein
VPTGSASDNVWLTTTPASATVPQLVTVTATLTEVVGGSTVGEDEGTVETGALQLSPTMPGAPVVTAGGDSPTEVITS